MKRAWQSHDLWAILFLIAWHAIYFFPVTFAQGVWFSRDIARLYYPFAVEYARALAAGHLPTWTTLIQSGFPLLAEGHVTAFYPTRALLLSLMPAHFALSYEMLIHLMWMAVGMYACVRAMKFRVATALLAGLVFSFGGYAVQKIYHTPILLTMAWLPWLIFLQTKFLRARREHAPRTWLWFLLLTLAAGVQWLEGFPQVALLNSMAFGAIGVFSELLWHGERWRNILRVIGWNLLPLVLGVGIAAIQIVPTVELIGFSTRVGDTMNSQFRTSYSLPPEFLAQFVLPFAQGEPTDDNNEYWAYLGIAPFVLALLAPFLKRDARTFFFAAFALIALSLTLGKLNPLYSAIIQLPVLNFFRVPARYLMLFSFGATLLAAIAFEEITNRATLRSSQKSFANSAVAIVFAVAMGATIFLAHNQPLDWWLSTWQFLPFALGALTLGTLALTRQLERGTFATILIGLTVLDLAAYAAPFLKTIDAISPPSYVTQIPRSIPVLGDSRDRVYTDETMWPSPPAIRASLLPNFGILYNKPSAHGYSPLVFGAYEAYFFNLAPAMLNLLNARYYLVPLEPRPETRAVAPNPNLGLAVTDNRATIPVTHARAIEVTSFTEGASEGTTAADLVISFDDGATQTFPLRVGIETANWDFGRTSGKFAPPSHARIAHSISGFWRSLGRPFDGYVYLARFELAATRNVIGIEIAPHIPASRFTVERVALVDDRGNAQSLAALTGKNEFTIKFLSDTAAVWENQNVLPRALLVHRARVMNDSDAFDAMHNSQFDPRDTLLIENGQALDAGDANTRDVVEIKTDTPNFVAINVTTERAGYLLLADSWYPGWNAFVNGRPAPIARADVIFRAVPIEPGQHVVTFEFQPVSLNVGAIVSLASLFASIAVSFGIKKLFPGSRNV